MQFFWVPATACIDPGMAVTTVRIWLLGQVNRKLQLTIKTNSLVLELVFRRLFLSIAINSANDAFEPIVAHCRCNMKYMYISDIFSRWRGRLVAHPRAYPSNPCGTRLTLPSGAWSLPKRKLSTKTWNLCNIRSWALGLFHHFPTASEISLVSIYTRSGKSCLKNPN